MRTKAPSTRRRISDAAARLFAEQRFHEVRMDDVAAAADVSKGTLYRYFEDKEDLYWELVARASREVLEQTRERVDAALSARDRLVAIVGSLINYFDNHPSFFDLLQHVEALAPKGREFPWSSVRHEFQAKVAATMAEFSPPPARLAQSALLLLGAVRAVIRFGEQPRPDHVAEEVVDGLLNGLLAPPRSSKSGV